MTQKTLFHPAAVRQVLELLPPDIAKQLDQQPTEILVAIFIGVVTVALILLSLVLGRSKRRGKAQVVLAGPCNAGKTTLFYQLRDGTVHSGTVASMQENAGTVAVKNEHGKTVGQVSMVDVPGHERLRHKLDQQLKDATAVIFVVDATDITPSKVQAAEELFEILTHPSIASKRVPILLACNKMDLDTQVHSVDFVKRTMERQIDTMRKTRTALSPEASARAAVLGKTDRAFSLTAVRNPISTASISAMKGDLTEVYAFLSGKLR